MFEAKKNRCNPDYDYNINPDIRYEEGPEGRPGKDGASSYELWLEQGNEGSLEEYFESLKGND